MLCITKCQRFKSRFSEVDAWSPIITKRIVSRPIIAILSFLYTTKKMLRKLVPAMILHRVVAQCCSCSHANIVPHIPINRTPGPQPNRIYYLSKVMDLPCPHRFCSLHVSLSSIILHASANNPHAKKQNKVLNFWVRHPPTRLNFFPQQDYKRDCQPLCCAEYLFVSINLVSLQLRPDSPFVLHVDTNH